MISTQNLQKKYGPDTVLDQVSIQIESGEFVAVVGASGSGKTTFLNVVGGLDRTYEGQITVNDQKLEGLSDKALAQKRNRELGFVFQQFNLLDHLSVLENVMLPAFFAAESIPQSRGLELLDQVGLKDKAQDRPPQLSGGQKQRVAIARALLSSPSILLCDEPTGSLDKETGLQIMSIFQELNESGMTVLLVTHEEHVAKLARRTIRFEAGKVISDSGTAP
ncbi:ABC transporter ATP-binding protein [Microvenator marinus]|uniref:ABC transporter ATP-binding protein n=1 Tax=Microvenator marinus TaxID=2600177 RepID=A0A5B8XRI8_9DELT|nr:ABC transporter ATP-binding protein [Microvenator marinus]QED27787.1 ABC transporter ATP-binding protein [Microvenator marinus]